jgi:exonuclease III
MIVNIYVLTIGTTNFIEQTLMDIKEQIDTYTMAVGDFNTPLSTDRPFRPSPQKLNKDTLQLNYTTDQMDLTDLYRVFHPTAVEYTFFSAAHGTFSKIDYNEINIRN